MVSIAAHVIVDGFDQSILKADAVYEFPQYGSDVSRYLPFMPKAHSTQHDRIQELAQAVEGLDVDILPTDCWQGCCKAGVGIGQQSK